MKTFELNQKVTHTTKGIGIVKRLRNNDTQGWAEFKGHGIWITADDKYITLGANEYKPKNETISIECLQTKIAMIRGEYCTGAGLSSEGGRIALDKLEQLILNK